MRDKSPSNRAADLLDIHVIDIAAQIEALLRSVREVQRGLLTIRGALPRKDLDPAIDVQKRLALMLRECGGLTEAVRAANNSAAAFAVENPEGSDAPIAPPRAS